MFEKYEEGVDWRGPRNLWKEDVLGEVLGWVQNIYPQINSPTLSLNET